MTSREGVSGEPVGRMRFATVITGKSGRVGLPPEALARRMVASRAYPTARRLASVRASPLAPPPAGVDGGIQLTVSSRFLSPRGSFGQPNRRNFSLSPAAKRS
jgi:hypothetical protein